MSMKLDLRFASDEDDAKEIAQFIRNVAKPEEDPLSNYYFRVANSCLSENEIFETFNIPQTRWIVLETPFPEEIVVAAAQIIMNTDSKEAKIPYLYVDSTSTTYKYLLDVLLTKIRIICSNFGISVLKWQIPQWRSDLVEFAESRNMPETGGILVTNEDSPLIVKDTMYIEYSLFLDPSTLDSAADSKSLQFSSNTRSSPPISANMASLDGSGAQLNNIFSMMPSLFDALHREFPQE